MIANDCARAEITAGAVALGEASEIEREAYRRHLSSCRHCVSGLGGERDIERTMQVIAQARETERWEPAVQRTWRDRVAAKPYVWRFALAAAATAAIVAIGVRSFVPDAAKPDAHRSVIAQRPVTAVASGPAAHRVAAGHDLVVLHNVAILRRPPLASKPPSRIVPNAVALHAPVVRHIAVSAAPLTVAAAAPSQRDERSIAALRTVGTAAPAPQGAESIALLPSATVNRDVVPVGGESAIVPHPLPIAYYENAEGTTAFEVSVDERGVPLKCSIVKSSGYLVLDEAVCRAAMRARYAPRIVNGRAVAGTYRDALTFAAGNGDQ
ncbi:MAG: energy transducer TonB [Candidatus Tumulicola sp.]